MYIMNVETKNSEFIAFLTEEAMLEQPRTYVFTDEEMACKVLSRFLLYFLREQIMEQYIHEKKINEQQKEDLVLYISSDDIVEILHAIQQKVGKFIHHNGVFHFEGFTQFRLKEEKNHLTRSMQHALDVFHEQHSPTANLDALGDILQEQTSQEDQLFMILESNNRIILRSDERIFLSEHTKNEDNVLSHLIILAPKVVKVHETHGQLTRESVIILRHLFKDKVAFTREKYIDNRYSKE